MAETRVDVDAILFDLDQTLYDPACGLLPAGDRFITAFLARRLGLSEEEADRLRARTWQQYGATARGVEAEFGVPQREFFAGSIEQCPVESYLQRRPELAAMLARLPQRLFIFTNASARYATRVLEALGIADCFERVFDIEFMGGHPKPEPEGYERVLRELELPAERVALIEDTEANLPPAARLGMFTVKLGPPPPAPPHVYLPDLLELPDLLRL